MKILIFVPFLFFAACAFAQDSPFTDPSSPLQKKLRERMQEQLGKYNPQSLRKELEKPVYIHINPGNRDLRWLPLDRMPCVVPIITLPTMPVVQPDLAGTNYHMPVIGRKFAGPGYQPTR